VGETNFSRFNNSKHEVRNLLPQMHPVSDVKDICPPKFGYNFSKIKREEPELRTSIEDFIQPKDQTKNRSTGYNSGHIRTVLQLDTFGPNHSDSVSEGRMSGVLPLSPNYDRNKSPNSKSNSQSRDLGSSTNSTHSKSEHAKSQILFGGTWNKDLLNSSPDQPLVRPSTSGYSQDARGSNWNYSKKRTALLKEQSDNKKKFEEYKRDKSRQEKESKEYQKIIDDFEVHLKSIKYY